MIITFVVWWPFFLLEKWVKVRANFFLFDSEFLILVLFQRPTTSKNGRSFLGEMVAFILVIDGIRDIFEARFVMQLCF
jgi:hypothetical protein